MTFLRNLTLVPDHSRVDSFRGTAPTLLMRNTFLVFRLVFLGLFFNFALLSLTFAAWNINASIDVAYPSSSASIFMIFQSCLIFFCILVALADIVQPKARLSRTKLECWWVAVVSIFQTGGAIGTVIATPGACDVNVSRDVCVSATLLIPISWLSTLLLTTYFMALFCSTMAHKGLYPDIWKRTIYSIQWFEGGVQPPVDAKQPNASDFYAGSIFEDDSDKDIYAAFYSDLEGSGTRKLSLKYSDEPAPWAASANPTRRGIDAPFARKPVPPAYARPATPPTAAAEAPLPALPEPSADPLSSPAGGSRFIEKFREANVLRRAEGTAEFASHYHARSGSFPQTVLDVDQPIPLTRLSEWVKAEDVKGGQRRSDGSMTRYGL